MYVMPKIPVVSTKTCASIGILLFLTLFLLGCEDYANNQYFMQETNNTITIGNSSNSCSDYYFCSFYSTNQLVIYNLSYTNNVVYEVLQ